MISEKFAVGHRERLFVVAKKRQLYPVNSEENFKNPIDVKGKTEMERFSYNSILFYNKSVVPWAIHNFCYFSLYCVHNKVRSCAEILPQRNK